MSLMWKSDNIDYFNLKFNEQKPDTGLIESSSQHVYYQDVYIFVNQLWVLALIKDLDALQVTISVCLCESALL